MSIPITPVDYETHIPGLELSGVSASFCDMAPPSMRKTERIIDKNFESRVELSWSQAGTNPWTDFFLTLANARWQATAMLKPVDGSALITRSATLVYPGSGPLRTVTVIFPADSLTEGMYQLFLNCHLKAGTGEDLATVFSAQGRTVEVFDAALVHP